MTEASFSFTKWQHSIPAKFHPDLI